MTSHYDITPMSSNALQRAPMRSNAAQCDIQVCMFQCHWRHIITSMWTLKWCHHVMSLGLKHRLIYHIAPHWSTLEHVGAHWRTLEWCHNVTSLILIHTDLDITLHRIGAHWSTLEHVGAHWSDVIMLRHWYWNTQTYISHCVALGRIGAHWSTLERIGVTS